MSPTDLCPRCNGDCPMIDCETCGGCEEVACREHNTPRETGGPVWIGSELDDDYDDTDGDYGWSDWDMG